MNKNAVYFNVSLKINAGQLDAFKEIAEAMIAVTRQESGALAYEWYFSDDLSRCRLIETYVDEAAVQAHIAGRAVQELVPRMLKVSSISNFEVYGYPGLDAAKVLTGIGAEIFRRWSGIAVA